MLKTLKRKVEEVGRGEVSIYNEEDADVGETDPTPDFSASKSTATPTKQHTPTG